MKKGFIVTVFLDFVFNCFLVWMITNDKRVNSIFFIKATILTLLTSIVFWYLFYRQKQKK